MVELRLTQREIVFRVLYAGDDGATKFATIRSLHESLCDQGETIKVLHAGGDRIVSFRHRPRLVEPLFGLDVSVEAITIPGRLRCPANAEILLSVADAIVYLDDRSHAESEDTVAQRFESFVGQLSSSRSNSDIPFWVQCYADGPSSRHGLFETSGDWEPDVAVLESEARPRAVYERVQDAMIGAAREWQKDLDRRGLNDHVKIRDRIYEKVALLPSAAPDSPTAPGEVRLVQSLVEEEERPSKLAVRSAVGLALLIVVAAFLVASAL